MTYSKEEVLQYIQEEDVKFIRLAFCNVFGKQKNISIMPSELHRAFSYGIAIDGSAVEGFADEAHSDLLLHPDPNTLTILPWRPEHGRVVRMFCTISYPNGTPFECDTRQILQNAIAEAERAGVTFYFGAEMEFYLFQLDETGTPTKIPYDTASYMDIAPDDKCENIRREICLTLEQMGIYPESSHHEEGAGQNEIDFRYADALTAAEQALTFQTVVKTIARRNGLFADFSPKPLIDQPGNGMHVNISVKHHSQKDCLPELIAGLLTYIKDMTVFLNPSLESYLRFGSRKAPSYISWSSENRSQLIRIPAAVGKYRRAELRSPDGSANPYLAFALMIYAGLEGIQKQIPLPPAADLNLFTADAKTVAQFERLPHTFQEAATYAANSAFISAHIPKALMSTYERAHHK